MGISARTDFSTFCEIMTAFNQQTEGKEPRALAINSFETLHCVREKGKRTTGQLRQITYLQKVAEGAHAPEGLSFRERFKLIDSINTFSSRLHQIIDSNPKIPSQITSIDSNLLRLKKSLQIDLLGYLATAVEVLQTALSLI